MIVVYQVRIGKVPKSNETKEELIKVLNCNRKITNLGAFKNEIILIAEKRYGYKCNIYLTYSLRLKLWKRKK